MRKKQIAGFLLTAAMVMSLATGCTSKEAQTNTVDKNSAESSTEENDGKIKEFSAFFTVQGSEINDDNEIQQKIADLTGVKVKETWLAGQTAEEAEGTLIAGGEYPDILQGTKKLYEAGALVALDDYIDKYPNIKNFYSKQEWDKVRQDDGHIYWIHQFNNIHGEEKACIHNDEAFWIQTRVLKWANYPEIRTMDEYFDLIERYNEAVPTLQDGTKNIPYTILCDDTRYFCLENAPEFLDGYPNDGSVIVDPNEKKIIDYNTTPTAKKYFNKLNEEFKKGIVDTESFTQKYDEYIAKLSTGRVLGMIDQWWEFGTTAGDAIRQAKLSDQGCDYVPLPITIDKSVKNQWHCSGGVLNAGSGLAISTDCKDVEGVLQFVDDLLSQKIQDLRFWGVKDVDYQVNDKGEFSRTSEMRQKCIEKDYKASHLCTYSYFPQWSGTSEDGINAMKPEDQTCEVYDNLPEDVRECFSAYNCKTYVDMLGTNEAPGEWYPMWSFSNNMKSDTPGGTSWVKMTEVKHEYLPKVVMAPEFESGWEDYMKAYKGAEPQLFIDEMQAELDRRIEEAKKYK